MKIENELKAIGTLSFYLRREDGAEEQFEVNNLVVTTGKNFLASAILNNSTSPFTQIGVGTGTNAAALTDTTLQAQIHRAAFTSSSVAGNVAQMVLTMGPGVATGAITEAGIFNAPSGGTMLSRVVFSAINKGSGDTLIITWNVTVG